MKFTFFCGDYETKVDYEGFPSDEVVNSDFDTWAFEYGFGCDELDEMFEDGKAGYYVIKE